MSLAPSPLYLEISWISAAMILLELSHVVALFPHAHCWRLIALKSRVHAALIAEVIPYHKSRIASSMQPVQLSRAFIRRLNKAFNVTKVIKHKYR